MVVAAIAVLAASEWMMFRLHIGDFSPFRNPDARGDAIVRTLPWVAEIDSNGTRDAAQLPASLLDWCERPEIRDGGNPENASSRRVDCRVSRHNPFLDHCWFWWLGRDCVTVVIPAYWINGSSAAYELSNALQNPCRYLRPEIVRDKLGFDSIRRAQGTLECDNGEFESDLFVVLLEPSFDLGPNTHVWDRVAAIHLASRE
jgi:hypothetical protein